MAIWAYNPNDPGYNYIGQVWKALLHYQDLLKKRKVILAGDFNSNLMWDGLKRKVSHSMVVEKLSGLNILSTYHTHHQLAHGAEEHPTFFLYRHKHRPYHLDYCFASRYFIDRLHNIEVGGHEEWAAYSDHSPMIINFGL